MAYTEVNNFDKCEFVGKTEFLHFLNSSQKNT